MIAASGEEAMSERSTALERQRMRATEARAAAKRAVPTARDLPFERLPGLYDPRHEHDSCGVGFVADLKGARSHDIIAKGLQILENLTHRGAVGADPLVGDGAGLLSQIPHEFFSAECAGLGFQLPSQGDYGVGYDPAEAKRLLMQAADRGDPNAKEALANLERNLADDAAKK